MSRLHLFLLTVSSVALLPAIALAQEEGDGPKKPDMHQLARSSALPKAHADFSRYRYRPKGDKVTEQPDANRLLFTAPDGTPDGYAERRGSAVIYHDRSGNVTHVQPLDD